MRYFDWRHKNSRHVQGSRHRRLRQIRATSQESAPRDAVSRDSLLDLIQKPSPFIPAAGDSGFGRFALSAGSCGSAVHCRLLMQTRASTLAAQEKYTNADFCQEKVLSTCRLSGFGYAGVAREGLRQESNRRSVFFLVRRPTSSTSVVCNPLYNNI